ncbi:SDR family NAD(P)-dependent oxidoreductase [Nocardia thailandica]
MTKTLAVFGYGPGLGAGTARRFGRAGFRVAVVGRDATAADGHVAALAAEGIDAKAFRADVTDAAQLRSAIDRIEAELGVIDVALHSAAAEMSIRSPSTLDTEVDALAAPFALKVHSPIALVRALAPAMIARGDGALLFSSGASEHLVQPYLANVGVALGAQRAYLRQLAAELDGTGVYIGLLNIGALIRHSRAQRIIDARPDLIPAGLELPRIGNDELGEAYWRLYSERADTELDIGFPG